MGFYFSPDDFYFLYKQGTLISRTRPEALAENNEELNEYTKREMRELMTLYGKIDIVFLDGMSQWAKTELAKVCWEIDPDVVISLDTTLCVDTPGVPEDQRVTQQGKGAGLLVMDSSMISDPDLLAQFETVARKRRIKHQRTILPRGGNDGATMQRAAEGRRAIALVCPTRYIHTVTEMIHLDDLHACRDLLTAYLAQAD